MIKRLLLILAAVTLAFGAPLAGAAAGEAPCAMTDAGGHPPEPCGCAPDQASDCAPACAALSPVSGTPFSRLEGAPRWEDGGRFNELPSLFASRAGPPGLQPPR